MTEHNRNKEAPTYASFRPAPRAMALADHIIDMIGQKSEHAPMTGPPTYVAEWPPYPQAIHYKLQKYDYGVHGKKYELDLTAPDEAYIARYVMYKRSSAGQEYSRILQVDEDGDECNMSPREISEMHDKLLSTLQRCVPDSIINQITDKHMNEEFNALMGRYLISDFAIEIDGQVPLITLPMALQAAEAHRHYYDGAVKALSNPENTSTSYANDEESEQTLSFELAAARALQSVLHKWQNTINRDIKPSERYPRSS